MPTIQDQQDPERTTFKLRTIEDLTEAHEFVFNKQRAGQIDAKTADGMNTTLKGAVYLNGKLKMDFAKIVLQAAIKKVQLPPGILPELVDETLREATGERNEP